jgi:hypothetical protein
MPKADRAMAALSSLLVGDGVDAGRREKRAEICSRCQLVQVRTTRRGNTKVWCGVCHYKLTGDRSIDYLARHEETKWSGCKHPEGSRWKAAGV